MVQEQGRPLTMYDVMISKYNVTDKDGGLFAAAASPYSPGGNSPFPHAVLRNRD